MKWTNLQRVMSEYADYLKDSVKKNSPDYYELPDKISFELQVGSKSYDIIFRAPIYWQWANNGRGPGKMPPSAPIEKWIEKRGILPRSGHDTPAARKGLAFLIRKKIGEKGTTGSHFLEKSLQDQADHWFDVIANAIAQDIAAELSDFTSPLNGNISI